AALGVDGFDGKERGIQFCLTSERCPAAKGEDATQLDRRLFLFCYGVFGEDCESGNDCEADATKARTSKCHSMSPNGQAVFVGLMHVYSAALALSLRRLRHLLCRTLPHVFP